MGLRRQPQAIVYAPGFVPGPVPGSGRYTELGKLDRGPEIDFVEHRAQARAAAWWYRHSHFCSLVENGG